MSEIILITGPTATGKTLIADKLCHLLDGKAEIISADSRQVYKYLKVGTNLTPTETPQHLVSFIEPDIFYSAQNFAEDAQLIIKQLFNSKKIPVIAGGTGLYIKAVMEGGLMPLPEADPEIRNRLNKFTTEELYLRLKKVDPLSAEKNRANPQRLKRAIEIYEITGSPMSEIILNHKKKLPGIAFDKEQPRFISFGLFYSDKNFYRKVISERADKMVSNSGGRENIIEEARKVTTELGYKRSSPALSAIGYREVFDYIDGKITFNTLKEKIISATVKYAKRQMTWFRHQTPPQRWIDVSEYHDFDADKIAKRILENF